MLLSLHLPEHPDMCYTKCDLACACMSQCELVTQLAGLNIRPRATWLQVKHGPYRRGLAADPARQAGA